MTTQLSVLMPVYCSTDKHMEFLREAIQSILDQTFTNLELVILDDCSPIDTLPLVESLKDSRIRYFKNETNLGRAKSRNRLVYELSDQSTEFIGFMDSDDVSSPNRFESSINYLEMNPSIGILGSLWYKVDSDLPISLTSMDKMTKSDRPASYDKIVLFNINYPAMLLPTCIMRRSIFTDTGIRFRRDRYEDIVFWSDIIDKVKIENLPEFNYYYRRHNEGQITGPSSWSELRSLLMVLKPINSLKATKLGFKDPDQFELGYLDLFHELYRSTELLDLLKIDKSMNDILSNNQISSVTYWNR